VLKRNITKELAPYLHQALEQLSVSKRSFKIQINGEIIDLPLEDILYMEVLQHSVTAHVLRKEKCVKEYQFSASLSELETQLEPQGFLRIHKSYLVNMRHIKRFQCREAILHNGMVLRVSEKGYAENKKKYLLWKGWQ
jgi:DNA-binding LytR/AlgR family response regulator